MRLVSRLVLCLSISMCSLTTDRAAADEIDAQRRAQIATERDAVQKRYDAKERDCAQRFVVTACMNAARKERRDALGPLRQDELRIDGLERRRRAAGRLEEIDVKQRADAAREATSEALDGPTAGASGAAAATKLPARPIVGPSSRPVVTSEERERREALSQARFDASQLDAQRRRQAAHARNAERAAAGKVARPLPIPPGASAP